MKAIIFARVSTMTQDLEQQEQVLFQTAKKDGYSDNDIIVISEHESAVKNSSSTGRPGCHIKEKRTLNWSSFSMEVKLFR